MKGHHEIVKVLIAAEANLNENDNEDLATPLHYASSQGHLKCVHALLCASIDISARDRDGVNALHVAAQYGQCEAIETLLSAGADVNTLDIDRSAPLYFAARDGHADAVTLLLDAGAHVNHRDKHGRSAIFFATSVQIVKALLARGASTNFLDRDRATVLHYAGNRGRVAAVLCALYKGGADPTLLDRTGESAADWARLDKHEDAAKMLDLLAAKQQSLQA